MEIKKQIAFDNNNLASFRKKWASFKQNNLIYTLNLSASDKQADGGWRTIYNYKLYYFCGLCLSFSFTFFPSVNDNSYLF